MNYLLIGLTLLTSISAFAIDGEYLGITSNGNYVYKFFNEKNVCVKEFDSLEQARMKASYCTGLKNLPQQQLVEYDDPVAEKLKNAAKIGNVIERLGSSSVKNSNVNHRLSWDIFTIEEKNKDINCLNIVNRSEPKTISSYMGLVVFAIFNPIDTYRVFSDHSSSGVTYSKVKEVCWNLNP